MNTIYQSIIFIFIVSFFFRNTITASLLSLFDFGTDCWVGINLYLACHYKLAAISFLFIAMPSIIILIYAMLGRTSCCQNRYHKKEFRDRLNCKDLCGLILCYPFYKIYITFREILGHNEHVVPKGLNFLELVAEALPQLVFTCFIKAYLGESGQSGTDRYI